MIVHVIEYDYSDCHPDPSVKLSADEAIREIESNFHSVCSMIDIGTYAISFKVDKNGGEASIVSDD